MNTPSRSPWYENPTAVAAVLLLMLLLVLSVWVVGIGAAYIDAAAGG